MSKFISIQVKKKKIGERGFCCCWLFMGDISFFFSPVILLHFLFWKEVSCITEDLQEAEVGQDDFESSFWPWDSEDGTKVKGLRVRHQQGYSCKQRVSRRDNDVTRKLLKICHVTGCYLHAFPSREGIKQKEGHVNFTQGPRWWRWRLRWGGESCKHESSGLTKLKQANNLHPFHLLSLVSQLHFLKE